MDLIIQMLPASVRKFSTHMDFVGQKKAEQVLQVWLVWIILLFNLMRAQYLVDDRELCRFGLYDRLCFWTHIIHVSKSNFLNPEKCIAFAF